MWRHKIWIYLMPLILLLLTGCSEAVLFHPQGQIGREEEMVILVTGGLMLLIVIPVIFLTLLFAWKYRASRKNGTSAPKPLKSKFLEASMWLAPALIVCILSVISWTMSHRLDPFRPIEGKGTPLVIQVIALDWKWLFVYPDQTVASVNEVAFPVNVPVHFLITSDTVMNSFFIPQLGSQIYAMAGMRSELFLIADQAGDYAGFSANISGVGFSGMKFTARALPAEQFEAWIQTARTAPLHLDQQAYLRLKLSSKNNPVAYYSTADPKLFSDVISDYSYGH